METQACCSTAALEETMELNVKKNWGYRFTKRLADIVNHRTDCNQPDYSGFCRSNLY